MAARLRLRKGSERRLRGGHSWVFSNEVDTALTPLAEFKAGQQVAVETASGETLAVALMDPSALICARVVAAADHGDLDAAFFVRRISAALALREQFFDQPWYRLIYGDSDALPGLIVDRYNDILVMQLNNLAIEPYRERVIAALIEVLQPAGVLLRHDSRQLREQGLEAESEVVFGSVPEQVTVVENGVTFLAPVFSGQKTGWFYDHRDNRRWLAQHVAGKSVLDVYSYIGGWGIQAAVAGAASVCCIDSSAPALEQVAVNARSNNLEQIPECIQGPADRQLQALKAQQRSFDVVVLDPPAFVQRRRDLSKGSKAYRRMNQLALELINDGGLLVSASCSMQLPEEELVAALNGAAQRADRRVSIVGLGHQGADHPVHPAIEQTRYLKAIFARVSSLDS